jgi:hypothetical protein
MVPLFEQVPPSGDATQNLMVAVPQESRVLFTLLVNAFSLLLEFALDLTNPFTGRYKVSTLLLPAVHDSVPTALQFVHYLNTH